ncbi:MarR family winged helix-turn-helix transcriptional regulator [Phyllobacterium myrsinacearum]|uniref:DNA-binding MarR family transcriptional regulator n=1 Tax=Phyllobacterium myrsinacearum TaxID=28101 RepID=A0A839EG27_9HYPH|nr:MarR family winged helix-turn-helix transcriptional regulator [Phyllobacterium myrsinacearum]MBA8877245.1 DNA-binding MarR family transcriptional regulator [Phyllobacterium myrsinacearum]
MTETTATQKIETPETRTDDDLLRIGRVMTRMRLMTGRRVIGRLAIQNVAPGLELTHLDVLDAVRRGELTGEVTVGVIAETLRIDPSRASRIVAEMVTKNVLRRKASQTDARRIVVVMTALGQRLVAELHAQKQSIVESVVADWSPEEIEIFSQLFEKYVDGFEQLFARNVTDPMERTD